MDSIEVWGDEDVYSWSMPLGMCSDVIKHALNSLEKWAFNEVVINELNLQAGGGSTTENIYNVSIFNCVNATPEIPVLIIESVDNVNNTTLY